MRNRLYSYLVNEKIYLKQFRFQKGHSTEYAIVQLADQIHESFENDSYTLGVFIDLSKAFDTLTLMIAKEIYEILHVEYRWALFLDAAFSSLCQ